MDQKLDSINNDRVNLLSGRDWAHYSSNYRAKEVAILADWIREGKSGTVVGLTGTGKSNFLGFICHRPDAIQPYLEFQISPVLLVPVDLNNLVDDTLATFYRSILRSFYYMRSHFPEMLQKVITTSYQENKSACDPFLPQSGLYELLFECHAQQVRIILVIDRFDEFCQIATLAMTNTLRGLRDSFKGLLSFIMGMRQEAIYMSDPSSLGELYEILDTRVCWVGPMSKLDARQLIDQETFLVPNSPKATDIDVLMTLTGNYPALLKAACSWWSETKNRPAYSEWGAELFEQPAIQYRLQEIWSGLSQEEGFVLAELQKSQSNRANFNKGYEHLLYRLEVKGICEESEAGWHIVSELFATYITTMIGRSLGKIWIDDETDEIYQGQQSVKNLTPLEREVLRFFIKRSRVRHPKTEIIINAWPDEMRRNGVTDDSLYQVISGLRKKIEPKPTEPCYIISWRGWPESGYQFFPEGRPR